MPLSQSQYPDLKAYREYDEHDTYQGLATSTGVLNKGTIVAIATNSGVGTVAATGTGVYNSPFINNRGTVPNTPSYATSLNFGIVNNTVRPANSGDAAIGINLYDCRSVNAFGEGYAWSRGEQKRDQVILPGEGLKIAQRGKFLTNGFSGVPIPGSGAYAQNGVLIPCVFNRNSFNIVGKWLEPADAEGYALIDLNCL